MSEEYKSLTGLYDHYEITAEGRGRNVDSKRLLKPMRTTDEKLWYYSLIPAKLRQDEETGLVHRTQFVRAHYLIHYLVAEAWLPNPRGYGRVKFKDGCKDNYIVSNLEWVS